MTPDPSAHRTLTRCAGSILAIVSAAFTPTALAAEATPAYAHALRQAIVFDNGSGSSLALAQRMQRWKVPGLNVAVIDDCKIVDSNGFGVTRRGGAQVQGDTLFQAASVTKPMAALAALRLVERGLLSLDGDVNAELRGWKLPASPLLAGHPVTLRGIFSHSAGLVPSGYRGYARDEPLPTLIQTLSGTPPAQSEPVRVAYTPGSQWRYSGGGYLVAQLLMVEKTGERFDKILNDEVLMLAHMARSSFAQPSRRQNVAPGHHADGAMVPGGWRVYPEWAAGGLWSTASDLARFGLAAMKAVRAEPGALLSPAFAEQMATAQAGPHSLGFEVGGWGQARHFGHEGTNEGYNSALILYPETCQGAAIMTNSDNGKFLIAELLRALADTYRWPDAMPSAVMKRVPQTPSVAARFQGTYRLMDTPDAAPFRIVPAGKEGFTLERDDGYHEPLYASGEGLVGPDGGIVFKAISPAAGPAEVITYTQMEGGDRTEARRVKATPDRRQ